MSSKEAAPFFYLNVCTECIYVTAQRLSAQKISSEKSSQILNDLLQGFLGTDSLEKHFMPTDTITLKDVRAAAGRIVNVSIMKVESESMNKLFDLGIMLFKFQIMCSTRPEQILELRPSARDNSCRNRRARRPHVLNRNRNRSHPRHPRQITRLHLEGLDAILTKQLDGADATSRQATSRSKQLVAAARMRMDTAFGGRTAGELHRIRQALLRVLQEQRIKCSVLLDIGLQNREGGAFNLPAPTSFRHGTVSYYDVSRGVVESQDKLKVVDISQLATRFFDYPMPLGTNMYAKDRLVLGSGGPHVDGHLVAPVAQARVDGEHFAAVTSGA